jgi:hypothetical protein
MSDYTVIREVSKTLRDILWAAFSTDATINNIVAVEDAIVFDNPNKTAQQSTNRLSLWLYQVVENEHAKNQTPPLNAQGNAQKRPPLALNLCYLVTPFGPTGEADLLILGKTMQTLYDSAIFSVKNAAGPIAEDLRIVLSQLTIEELGRIWESLQEPYRLSVCYQVRFVNIVPTSGLGAKRVLERTAGITNQVPQPVEVLE